MLVWPGRITYSIDLGYAERGQRRPRNRMRPLPVVALDPALRAVLQNRPARIHHGACTFRLAQVKLAARRRGGARQFVQRALPLRRRRRRQHLHARSSISMATATPSSGLQLMGTVNNVPEGTELTFPMTRHRHLAWHRVQRLRPHHGDAHRRHDPVARRLLRRPAPRLRRLLLPAAPDDFEPGAEFAAGDAVHHHGLRLRRGQHLGHQRGRSGGARLAGPDVTGIQAGTTQVLGFGGSLGTRTFPIGLSDRQRCVCELRLRDQRRLATGSAVAGRLRVMSRSTISGQFTTSDVPISSGHRRGRAGELLGDGLRQHRDGRRSGRRRGTRGRRLCRRRPRGNPDFTPAAFQIVFVPSAGTYSGALANGSTTCASSASSPGRADGAPSPAVLVTRRSAAADAPRTAVAVAGSGRREPRDAQLVAGRRADRPPTTRSTRARARGRRTWSWRPMGAATSITAIAPVGVRIYVRVVATNAGGSATSNEVHLHRGAARRSRARRRWRQPR